MRDAPVLDRAAGGAPPLQRTGECPQAALVQGNVESRPTLAVGGFRAGPETSLPAGAGVGSSAGCRRPCTSRPTPKTVARHPVPKAAPQIRADELLPVKVS